MVSTTGCDDDCTFPSCGDGVFNDPAEICDTGGNTVGCDSDCTLPACNDGIFNDPAEVCDTGGNSASCDSDCTAVVCGDNLLNTAAGEECDDNDSDNNDNCVFANGCKNAICGDGWRDQQAPGLEGCDGNNDGTGGGTNTLICDTDCTTPACGDGIFNDPAEVCDDSNGSNLDDCKNDCSANTCGDGFVDGQGPATEFCDLGVAINGTTTCAYNATSDAAPTCNICNVGCTANAGPFTGPYCGDSTTQAGNGESCDDNNALACGTCNGACTAAITPAKATGSLQMIDGDPLSRDNERFTLNDGFVSLTFEYDGDNDCCGATGRIPIDFDNSNPESTPAELAVLTRDAINAQFDAGAIRIQASVANPGTSTVVTLTHAFNTSLGNQSVIENVADAGFTVTGMSGGAAGDCAVGVQCKTDADCNPNFICKAATLGAPLTCELPTCGDGIITAALGEECDDGNSSNNDSCPGSCQDAECGDGFEWNTDGGAEQCDDGNPDNDDSCLDTCVDATCGDGFVWNTDGGTEACDDMNNNACGVCDLNCTAAIVPNNAEGSFTAPASSLLDDGDTFTIGDGVHAALIFEFDASDVDDIVNGTNIRVDIDDAGGINANTVATRMRSAITAQNGVNFTITVGGSNAAVDLTNTVNTSLGNGTLASDDADLTFTQMSGGAGANCGSNIGCNGANICTPSLTCDTVTDNRCE
jgi:cysteine-rich repeat protein